MITAVRSLGLQMSDTDQSRIAVLETKVVNLDEKIDDLKRDVKDLHECLDRTRDMLKSDLKVMREEANSQHQSLSKRFSKLEDLKNKSVYMIIGAAAVFGWFLGHSDLAKRIFLIE